VENAAKENEMEYTSRGLKRRRNTDKWEVTLSHRDPLTGEQVPSYHTVEAKTRKRAEKARDELILDLERKGGAYTSKLTLAEFLDRFIDYKEEGRMVEQSTISGYRKEARVVKRYLGATLLRDVSIPIVSSWMAQMTSEGYAPRTVAKAFCEMNGFESTFHDLRHTFATMMIAGGTDVRTVASCLGHSNVAMTLNTYAEVDPDAKKAALGKVDEAFDIDLEGVFKEPEPPAFTLEFTVEQLEGMLAEARRRECGVAQS
jgi:hypothetical protein